MGLPYHPRAVTENGSICQVFNRNGPSLSPEALFIQFTIRKYRRIILRIVVLILLKTD
jgi:hypothetical protein